MASPIINIQVECLDSSTIIANGGSVVENLDGSVSVYTSENLPVILSKLCCETLNSKYFFDIDNQTCKWSNTPINTNCSLNDAFKVVLNPTGNDGSMFIVEPNDNCSLTIDFDYLFKVKCETLVDILSVDSTSGCSTPISVLETLDVSVTIDVITTANTLETVFEHNLFPAIGNGNLYTYLTTHSNSGLYICGNETPSGCTALSLNISGITSANTYSCESILNSLVQDLYFESGLSGTTGGADTFTSTIIPSALASQWLHYSSVVTDPAILALIQNKKIKLTLKINNTCSDICILVDELVLDKTCTRVKENNIFLSQSPGFELDRIRDNKKSWVGNASPVNRNFKITNNKGGNLIRQTNYDVNDERLVINSKEIDLDISLASAIETDVWCYLVDNPCMLTGGTCVGPSCPAGYSLTPGNDSCVKTVNILPTSSPTIFTAVKANQVNTYNDLGTNFYSNIDNVVFPIGDVGNTGPLKDNLGVPIPILANVVNPLWGDFAFTGVTHGRLNNAGIWATTGGTPTNEYIGFTYCLTLQQGGVYSLGICGDNYVRIKINGVLIVNIDEWTTNFNYWHVFPMTFNSGVNIIELEGKNASLQAAFAAEIYSTTPQVLSGLTTTSALTPYIIFSTLNKIGTTFDLGENSGSQCPSGYALNSCGSVFTCTKKEIANVISVDCPSNIIPCSPCSTNITNTTCGNKSFQDDDCFDFMDDEVYDFMDGDFNVDSINLGDTCCGDNRISFTNLLTQPLSGITTVEDFEYFMTSELIDAKSRKTLSGYPTLRALYDRYMNSELYCGTQSSKFDYLTIDQFAGLVGNYWVDIVEQVIPATTIWGSVKIYSNTIFDQQKFKYKSYSSLFCNNPFTGQTISSPINGTHGECADVEVIMTSLTVSTGETLNIIKVQTTICDKLCLAQMNMGSEFIGSVTIIGSEPVVIVTPVIVPPLPPPVLPCTTNIDCPPGYWCIAGTCVPMT